jgi:molecular chaperone DnaK
MEQINEAWKNASEELYKAQAEAGATGEPGAGGDAAGGSGNGAADVTDVEFEEVK